MQKSSLKLIKHRNLNELHKAIFTPQYLFLLPPDALHTAVEASGTRIAKSTLGWLAAQHLTKLVVDFRKSRRSTLLCPLGEMCGDGTAVKIPESSLG